MKNLAFNLFSQLVLAAILCVVADSVWASGKLGAVDITSSAYIVKYIFFLIFVLLLCFFCLWIIKRFKVNRIGDCTLINIVSSYSIGPKERLILVSVSGDYLLLSVAGGNIRLLYKLDKPPVRHNNHKEVSAGSVKFIDNLKHYILEQRSKA